MGNDTPLAVLSDKPQLLYNYFRQQFAQVTNPPIDPLREELVMSLTEYIGAVGMNILTPSESHCKMVRLNHPILSNTQLDILCNIRYKGFKTVKLPMLFEVAKGKAGLQEALTELCKHGGGLRNRRSKLYRPDRPECRCHSCSDSFTSGSECRSSSFNFCRETRTDSADCGKRRNT